MTSTTQRIARRFLDLGGRFLINPAGIVSAMLDAAVICAADTDRSLARMRRINGAVNHILDRQTPEFMTLLARYAVPSNGWMVWQDEQAAAFRIWGHRLTIFQRARTVFEANDDDAISDDLCERYCAAMDRLIAQSPAPSFAEVVVKLDLGRERAGVDGLYDDHAKAIRADLVRLTARATA